MERGELHGSPRPQRPSKPLKAVQALYLVSGLARHTITYHIRSKGQTTYNVYF
jgi:hypothetical protein